MLHLPGGGAAGGLNNPSTELHIQNKIGTVSLNGKGILWNGIGSCSGYTLYYVNLDLTDLFGFSGGLQYFLGFRRLGIRCNEGEMGEGEGEIYLHTLSELILYFL